MPLTPGARLGAYKVVGLVGSGGMGEVYRAHDTRLGRDVAIKILPASFAGDSDRLARFDREARTLASLNHANIAAIYGIEGTALVMELVEGDDLSAVVARGPVPVVDAVAIARQIALALEAAHEAGVIHRDLKPANVKVKNDGTVKVLDFGLAKAIEQPGGPGGSGGRGAEGVEATMTSPAMTQLGMILGTAAYMSPEQAKGRFVDKRADVWAFGVVLYEMLTGRPLFDGDSVAETIGFVATRDPDWTALPTSTPSTVRRLLARCLTRDPKHRLRDIGEARIMIDAPDDVGLAAGSSAPAVDGRLRRARMIWIGGALVLAAITAAAAWWLKPATSVPANVVTRFNTPLPEGQRFMNTGRHSIAISPDGTKLAYIANSQIYLRGMDQLEAQPIRGTDEGPYEVLFSPDGQAVAYFTREGLPSAAPGAYLKRIPIGGGTPGTLAQVEALPSGASWRGSTIIFGIGGSTIAAIQTVQDSGGTPVSILTFDRNKEIGLLPRLLDDGDHVLMSVATRGVAPLDGGEIVIQSITSGERTVLVRGGSDARLLSTGHLVYVKDSTLFAVAIDIERFQISGAAVPVVEGVLQNSGGVAQFAIADNGTLVMIPSVQESAPRRTLVWVDRKGKEEPIPARPRAYHHLRLAPDGRQLAVEIRDEESDIWIWDLTRDALTRLTFEKTHEGYPVWSPDSRYLFYRSDEVNVPGTTIYRRAADGTGRAEKIFNDAGDASPQTVSKDGKYLVYRGDSSKTARDLMLLPLDPPGPATPLIQTEFTEDNGQISPDGRWIAYESQDSGQREVFVRPFPAVDTAKVPVSSGGGSFVKWSRDGRELFFVGRVDGTQTLMSAAVPVIPSGARFTSSKAEPLFPWTPYLIGATQSYDVSLDGRRFVAIKLAVASDLRPSITVVTNWFEELRARVKGK